MDPMWEKQKETFFNGGAQFSVYKGGGKGEMAETIEPISKTEYASKNNSMSTDGHLLPFREK